MQNIASGTNVHTDKIQIHREPAEQFNFYATISVFHLLPPFCPSSKRKSHKFPIQLGQVKTKI